MNIQTVDDYIAGLGPRQAAIVSAVRKVVLKAAPEATEAIKWAQPVFELNGPLCYIKAFQSAVNFGFWRGADLDDPTGALQGTGDKMRHIKLTNVKEVNATLLAGFVRQAMALNLAREEAADGA